MVQVRELQEVWTIPKIQQIERLRKLKYRLSVVQVRELQEVWTYRELTDRKTEAEI